MAWHDAYDDHDSRLARRLALVQARIGQALDALPAGPLRAVSACAGQGRDLIGVLAAHPRRRDVVARLVELEPANAAYARRLAEEAGLDRVEIVTGDASTTDAYAGAVPADLVLMCGVFGNISHDDVRHTIECLPMLCGPGAHVVWTRHPGDGTILPMIDGWFVDGGFERIALDGEAGTGFGVGLHRLNAAPRPFEGGVRLFRFVD